MSICPETTWQILESQHVYLSLFAMDLYMQLSINICKGEAKLYLYLQEN